MTSSSAPRVKTPEPCIVSTICKNVLFEWVLAALKFLIWRSHTNYDDKKSEPWLVFLPCQLALIMQTSNQHFYDHLLLWKNFNVLITHPWDLQITRHNRGPTGLSWTGFVKEDAKMSVKRPTNLDQTLKSIFMEIWIQTVVEEVLESSTQTQTQTPHGSKSTSCYLWFNKISATVNVPHADVFPQLSGHDRRGCALHICLVFTPWIEFTHCVQKELGTNVACRVHGRAWCTGWWQFYNTELSQNSQHELHHAAPSLTCIPSFFWLLGDTKWGLHSVIFMLWPRGHVLSQISLYFSHNPPQPSSKPPAAVHTWCLVSPSGPHWGLPLSSADNYCHLHIAQCNKHFPFTSHGTATLV